MDSKSIPKRITLNVGGTKYEVLWKTLEFLPQTRLGRLSRCTTHEEIMELCDDYSLVENEYFFNRQPRSFGSILHFYCTGKLHLGEGVCTLAFFEDLEYWGIHEFDLELCCENKYFQQKKSMQEEMQYQEEAFKKKLEEERDYFSRQCCPRYQKALWELLEKPKSSVAAQIVRAISIIINLLSTTSLSLNTIPCFKDLDSPDNYTLKIIDMVCIGWFTLEYLLRFLTAPSKWKFFKNPLNIIDLLAIIPYLMSLILKKTYTDVVEMLLSLRILMILKLARYSKGFQTLGFTLRNSLKELGLLMLFLYIGIEIFSTMAYFAEKNEPNSKFKSIPQSFWWASISMITMTVTSFDGMCPVTTFGKAVGIVCCLCGVLVITLPIPIIMNNFTDYYKSQTLQEKAMKRYEAIENARGDGDIGTAARWRFLFSKWARNENEPDVTKRWDLICLDDVHDAETVDTENRSEDSKIFVDDCTPTKEQLPRVDRTNIIIMNKRDLPPEIMKRIQHFRYAST